MLSNNDFVRQSLELNLFFMRIAKEHAIFLEAAFTPKNHSLMQQADALKNEFSILMMETIRLSQGVISPEVLNSGEIFTDLTIKAEMETQYYSSIAIDSRITNMEIALSSQNQLSDLSRLVIPVSQLNQRAIHAANQIAYFKERLLQDVLSCRVFTMNYPLLIDHVLREAKFYLRFLGKLQRHEDIDIAKEMAYQEAFWNRIMAEHAKFIRGLLDPVEVQLFDTANDFGRRFDELTVEAQGLADNMGLLPQVTEKSLENTINIRDFKRQGTEGLIDCKIRSIALPLLGDHVVREANHYIRLLKGLKKV